MGDNMRTNIMINFINGKPFVNIIDNNDDAIDVTPLLMSPLCVDTLSECLYPLPNLQSMIDVLSNHISEIFKEFDYVLFIDGEYWEHKKN